MTEEDKSVDLLGVKPIAKSVEKVTEGAIDGAEAFLSRICLPAAEEFGLLLRDKVSNWRAQNSIKIIQKSQLLLDDRLSEVVLHAHPRIVYDALEKGSWAEDDHMQKLWSGLLASSCSEDGKDESNLIFINILAQLTSSQGALINYACSNASKHATAAGWINCDEVLIVKINELERIMGIADFHQLDRELDHLRSLDLIFEGFVPEHTDANIAPTALCLQLFVRCQGYVGSPLDYFGIEKESPTEDTST